MKKYSSIFLIIVSACFSSCFEDKGNYDYSEKIVIVPHGLDSTYSRNTLETLQINITPEPANLNYETCWLVYSKGVQGTPPMDTIGTELNLNYKIGLPAGEYRLIHSIKDVETGIGSICEVPLNIKTKLSEGWWILKDKDNVTDIDHFFNGVLSTDVVSTMNDGYPLRGKAMDLNYYSKLSELEAGKISKKAVLFVLSEEDMVAVTLADGKILRNFDELFFTIPKGKKPGKITTEWSTGCFLVNDGGVHSLDESATNQGLFLGRKSGNFNISPKFIRNVASLPLFFDNTSKSFCSSQIKSLKVEPLKDNVGVPIGSKPLPVTNTGCELMMMGGTGFKSGKVSSIYALLKKSEDIYYLRTFRPEVQSSYANPSLKQDTLDSSFKITKADIRATNMKNPYIYFAKGNEIYAYSVTYKTETLQKLNIPANEKITYMEHIIYEPGRDIDIWFDCMVVATESNGKYKVYLYKVSGGDLKPSDEPVISGDGSVKEVIYRDLKGESAAI